MKPLKHFALSRALIAFCFAASVAVLTGIPSGPAFALSELQKEETPVQPQATTPATPPAQPAQPNAGQTPPATTAPGTEPAQPQQAQPDQQSDDPQDQPTTEDQDDPDQGVEIKHSDPNAPLPEVSYDLTKLPEPVQRMHKLLLEAAKTGDPEKLRPLLGMGEGATQLSLADQTDDPIKFLKSQSGDEAGQEILAILEEVLEAGYVHMDAGTPQDLYVWPYFFAFPLDRLTPQQKVEIYRIVTASDFDEMQGFGNYIFYRVGISPEGRWAFFVAGE